MPRPYSFDHYQVPKTLPAPKRSLRRQDKARLAHSKAHPEAMDSHEGVHYGKRFAETEELYIAHQMEAQLEELARPEPDAKFSHGPSFTGPKRRTKRAAKKAETPAVGATSPIGALPPTREQPPRARMAEIRDEAGHQVQALRGGLGDAVKAVSRLILLPVTIVRMAAGRILPLS
ncbi:hypothetical protein [Comamonas sp. JC664]|uniref:hypothetical protein n=1 Tax=Comamonas sp. JC664 TaxID=2801917 RepID=UPI00191F13CB|nr:hypothetical protein [Comamonas sp. JC664]MBL0693641.1 hypothetical protein [Comamonas sp. JC664]GHG73641.1 hypothetical protein GCM10012319_20640 [Comamonas sp. KCTC 72670]